MLLDYETLNELVTLLSPLLEDEQSRRALLRQALTNSPVLKRIDFTGPTEPFTVNMLNILANYGEVEPGKPALTMLLKTAKKQVGVNKQSQIEAIVDSIARDNDTAPAGMPNAHVKTSQPEPEPSKGHKWLTLAMIGSAIVVVATLCTISSGITDILTFLGIGPATPLPTSTATIHTSTNSPSPTHTPPHANTSTPSITLTLTPDDVPTAAQTSHEIGIFIFIDEDSLTIYIPSDQYVSLEQLRLETSIDDQRRTWALDDFRGFAPLHLDRVLAPTCLRIESVAATQPIPAQCADIPSGRLTVHKINLGDIFWYDHSSHQAQTVLILQGEMPIGYCSVDVAPCEIVFAQPTHTPTFTPTSTPSITLTNTPSATPTNTPTPTSILTHTPDLTNLPIATQASNRIVVFIDEDSLTIYVPGDQYVSLEQLRLETVITGERYTWALDDFQGFAPLRLDHILVPTCLRIESMTVTQPIPAQCEEIPSGNFVVHKMNRGNIFWYDYSAHRARTVSILHGEISIGSCSVDVAPCEMVF